jgi:hypothetical protein
MGLTKKPARAANIDAFIQGAPDAVPAPTAQAPVAARPAAAPIAEPAPKASRKQGISVTMQPALLAQLDDTAQRMGLSRAAAISLAVSRLVASEGAAK